MEQPYQPQKPSQKPLIIGILNLVFAAIYVYLAINAATRAEGYVSQVPSSYRGAMRTANFLDITADAIGAIGMLLGGFMLLQKRAQGRTITRLTSSILVVAIVVIVLYTLIGFGSIAGRLLFPLILGLVLRFAYPIIAARLLSPSPEELGLT